MTGFTPGRIAVLALFASLIAALMWLDQHRAGPANSMARCNLLLTRSDAPAADILILGSSRVASAVDPVVLQQLLTQTTRTKTSVDRLAIGHNPLRAMHGFFETYLGTRGAPKAVVLEIMFMTPRSVDSLIQRGHKLPPEKYLYRRDVNVLKFRQLINQPALSMPFT